MTNQDRKLLSKNRITSINLPLLCILSLCSVNCQLNSTSINATSDSNLTTSEVPSSTVTEELLLSGEEFVDHTEAPVLLYDSLSTKENSTNPSQSNRSTSAHKIVEEVVRATTSKPSLIETTTTVDIKVEDEEEEEDSNDSEPFEPPKNVSQYMDYIERLFHDLRHQITDLFEPHIPQLIRTSQMVQLSESCSYDMLRLALALRQFEPWALRMIDSSGKVPEGIFEGSFTALGSYDECLSTTFGPGSSSSNDQGATQGKYCLVNVSPYLPPKPPADKVERLFQEEANRRNYTKDDQFSRLSPMFYYMKFRIGACVPSTCLHSDLENISNALSSSLRLNITIPHCKYKLDVPITNNQLLGGFAFGFILTLVIGATLLDYHKKKVDSLTKREQVILDVLTVLSKNNSTKTSTAPIRFMKDSNSSGHQEYDKEDSRGNNKLSSRLDEHWTWLSFSLFTNNKLYFQELPLVDTRGHGDKSKSFIIKCLDGIRVLSLCWVIIANSYITLDPRATKRLTKTREAPRDFLFQMVVQASLAIETFFFLSGILMSISFARKLAPHTGRKSSQPEGNRRKMVGILRWLHFYIHRYIRMTPATMLVIAFTMFAFRFGDGPLWIETTLKAHQSCSQNWWRHLLHIANFIDTRQMCFIHYWYIAADMQLFLFAPLLMLILYKKRQIGYGIVALIGLFSIGNIFYTTYMRSLPPTLLFYNSDPESRREFGNTIMTKPWTHALPYMVGMLVGKWLIGVDGSQLQATRSVSSGGCQSIKDRKQIGGNNSLMSLFGFTALLVALGEVFIPYKWNNSHLPSRFFAALYAAVFRFAWSLALAYLVVSCRHKREKRCDQEQACTRKHSRRFGGCECYGCHESGDFNRNSCCSNYGKDGGGKRKNSSGGGGATYDETSWCYCGSGGGVLNRLLSLNIFTHLSKLSFVAYLIHLPLMSLFIAQTRGLFAFSHTLVLHLALSYLLMTFILSFILVHIIEFPFLTLEKYLFNRVIYPKKKAAGEDKAENLSEMKITITNGAKMAATIGEATTKQINRLEQHSNGPHHVSERL